MSRSRSLLVGLSFCRRDPIASGRSATGAQTTDEPRVPGRSDYLSPHEVPFPSAESVSLAAASSARRSRSIDLIIRWHPTLPSPMFEFSFLLPTPTTRRGRSHSGTHPAWRFI